MSDVQATDVGGSSAGIQALEEQQSKYTYGIIIRNLPETWARRNPIVQRNFLQMLQSYTQVNLRSPSTSEQYATSTKEDGRQYCYGFISTYNKPDGDEFIRRINKVEIDGKLLEAKWSSQ